MLHIAKIGRDTWHGRQIFCPSIAELFPSLLSVAGRAQVAGFGPVTPGSSGWFSFYRQTFTSSSPASDGLYVCSALEEVRQLQQLCGKPRKWFSWISQVNKHAQVLSSPILKVHLPHAAWRHVCIPCWRAYGSKCHSELAQAHRAKGVWYLW